MKLLQHLAVIMRLVVFIRLVVDIENHTVMFELKLAQGAKPGKGGILPAAKVNAEIAGIRGIPVGQASISPNRHPDISNNRELMDRLAHIREVTGKPVGINPGRLVETNHGRRAVTLFG